MRQPLYLLDSSFEENSLQGPYFQESVPVRTVPMRNQWHNVLGCEVMSRIGIPACALTTSKGIALMAGLGFDILTYKTIRTTSVPSHPLPNICYVAYAGQFNYQDIGTKIGAQEKIPHDMRKLAISNSFGMGCFGGRDWLQQDIVAARKALVKGQMLIVSIFGTGSDNQSLANDFALAASLAYEAGAQVIEANLSCPNIGCHKPLYYDCGLSAAIVKAIGQAVPVPVIIKVGIPQSYDHLKQLLITTAHAGLVGMCGINSVSMQVVDQNGDAFFGLQRQLSGISGNPIRSLALDFVRNARKIIDNCHLNITLLAAGGITMPEHFDLFFNAGADVALSATGAMWNPYLAHDYHLKTLNYKEKKYEINQPL